MVTKGQLSERLGDYGGELRKLEAQIEELQEWREAKASLLWAKEQSVYLSRENAGRIAVLEKEAAAASAAAVRIRDLEGIVSAMGKRLGSKDIQLESMVRAAEGRIAALEQVVAERWGPTDGRHEMKEEVAKAVVADPWAADHDTSYTTRVPSKGEPQAGWDRRE